MNDAECYRGYMLEANTKDKKELLNKSAFFHVGLTLPFQYRWILAQPSVAAAVAAKPR